MCQTILQLESFEAESLEVKRGLFFATLLEFSQTVSILGM